MPFTPTLRASRPKNPNSDMVVTSRPCVRFFLASIEISIKSLRIMHCLNTYFDKATSFRLGARTYP